MSLKNNTLTIESPGMIRSPMPGQARLMSIFSPANLAMELSGESIDENSRFGCRRNERGKTRRFRRLGHSFLPQSTFPSLRLHSYSVGIFVFGSPLAQFLVA